MKELQKVIKRLVEDGRIGPVHVSVYLALFLCMRAARGRGIGEIRREEVMRLAKIQGKTTYYRIMKDLARWEYIEYRPGDGTRSSKVRIA